MQLVSSLGAREGERRLLRWAPAAARRPGAWRDTRVGRGKDRASSMACGPRTSIPGAGNQRHAGRGPPDLELSWRQPSQRGPREHLAGSAEIDEQVQAGRGGAPSGAQVVKGMARAAAACGAGVCMLATRQRLDHPGPGRRGGGQEDGVGVGQEEGVGVGQEAGVGVGQVPGKGCRSIHPPSHRRGVLKHPSPGHGLAAVQTGRDGIVTAAVWLLNAHTVQQHDCHLAADAWRGCARAERKGARGRGEGRLTVDSSSSSSRAGQSEVP